MFPVLLVAFLIVPIIELAVIIEVGQVIGVPATVVVLLLDSLAGAVLVRREGRRAWDRFRGALAEARWPGDEVAQGALLLFGAALLLTPGFVTDIVGLLLVLPWTRSFASRILRRRLTPQPVRTVFDAFGPDRADERSRRRRTQRTDTEYDVEIVRVERDVPANDEDEDGGDGRSSRQLGGGPS